MRENSGPQKGFPTFRLGTVRPRGRFIGKVKAPTGVFC